MTFSSTGRSSSHNEDVPPVPQLPKGLPMSPLSKPLPVKPRHHSSTDNLRLVAHRLPAPPLRSRKGKGKKAPEALKAPELHHVPQLLPVFTEMVSYIFDLDKTLVLIHSGDAATSSS